MPAFGSGPWRRVGLGRAAGQPYAIVRRCRSNSERSALLLPLELILHAAVGRMRPVLDLDPVPEPAAAIIGRTARTGFDHPGDGGDQRAGYLGRR